MLVKLLSVSSSFSHSRQRRGIGERRFALSGASSVFNLDILQVFSSSEPHIHLPQANIGLFKVMCSMRLSALNRPLTLSGFCHCSQSCKLCYRRAICLPDDSILMIIKLHHAAEPTGGVCSMHCGKLILSQALSLDDQYKTDCL